MDPRQSARSRSTLSVPCSSLASLETGRLSALCREAPCFVCPSWYLSFRTVFMFPQASHLIATKRQSSHEDASDGLSASISSWRECASFAFCGRDLSWMIIDGCYRLQTMKVDSSQISALAASTASTVSVVKRNFAGSHTIWMQFSRSINWRHWMFIWIGLAHVGSSRRLPALPLGCSVQVIPSACSA